MKKCVVIGSINMDMTARVERFPRPGETVRGTGFAQSPGGKGANQAVALGRLGGDVAMAGCVGDDASGALYLENFRKNGVDFSLTERIGGCPTGTAVIEVDSRGENHIVIVPGANDRCGADWLERRLPGLEAGDIFLLQLEIPRSTVFAAIKRLRERDKFIILDPAPAAQIPRDILAMCDIVTPNETELRTLTRDMDGSAGLRSRMEHLRGSGVGTVIAKCGADGAYVLDGGGFEHIRGFAVEAADTTAAGDTFNAAVAYSLALGRDIRSAAVFANAAAALSVTAPGAQGGMPSADQVEAFLAARRD